MKTSPTFTIATALLLAAGRAMQGQVPEPSPSPGESPMPGFVAAFQPSVSDPLAVRQARAAARLSREMLGGERQLLLSFRTLYAEVWRNRDGLTPQQVCDALGTKAASLFVIAGTMANAIYQIDPVGIGSMIDTPPGYAAALNADGTVSVTHVTLPTPSPSPAGTP